MERIAIKALLRWASGTSPENVQFSYGCLSNADVRTVAVADVAGVLNDTADISIWTYLHYVFHRLGRINRRLKLYRKGVPFRHSFLAPRREWHQAESFTNWRSDIEHSVAIH